MRYLDAVGLWCAVGYAALAVLARQPGEPDLPAFFLLVAWTGLPVFGLYWYARRRGEPVPVGRLFLWAVVFRLCGLAGGPFYEDDFYRYLWDAYRFATTGTPYGAAPEAFFIDPSVPALFQGVLDGINYPELPTIYGPTTQLVFLLGYWVQPASVTALQAILIAVDVVTLVLLLRLTSTTNVFLYAWCPLVVKEIAFTAHPDGAGACLLLAAIVLALDRRWSGAAILLGLAAGAKTFGLVLAPLVLARAPVRYWLLFGAIPVRLALREDDTRVAVRAVRAAGRHGPRVTSGLRPGVGVQLGALRTACDGVPALRRAACPGPGLRSALGLLLSVVRATRSSRNTAW